MTRRSRRDVLAQAGVAGSALLTGCLGLGGDDCVPSEESVDLELPSAGWPTLRANPSHTGTVRDEEAAELVAVGEVDSRELVVRHGSLSTPVVVDGKIYFGDYESTYALDARTRDEYWTGDGGEDTFSSGLTIASEIVYVPTLSDGLFALDRSTGERRFTMLGDEKITTPVLPVDGRLVIGTGEGVVQARDPICGGGSWQVNVGELGLGLGAGDGFIAAAALDTLVRIDADDGTVRWRAPLPGGNAPTNPALVDGLVIVPGIGNHLLAFDSERGERVWSVGDETPLRPTPPAVTAERVLVIDREGRLRSFETDTGAHDWTFDPPMPIETAPTRVADGVLVAGGEYLCLVNASDGRELGRAKIPSERYRRSRDLIISGSAVYLQSAFETMSQIHRFTA